MSRAWRRPGLGRRRRPGAACPTGVLATGDAVVFLGDSLTHEGWGKRDGWVHQVVAALSARGIRIRAVGAGVPGDRSVDMLARFERDVAARRPDWLVLSCGVNDVWHGEHGCSLEEFRDAVAAMLDRATALGISVLCATATVIGEDVEGPANRALAAYNEAVRALAGGRGLRLADCDRAFRAALRAPDAIPGTWLTEDGVHFNARGEAVMARAVLDAWGIGERPAS